MAACASSIASKSLIWRQKAGGPGRMHLTLPPMKPGTGRERPIPQSVKPAPNRPHRYSNATGSASMKCATGFGSYPTVASLPTMSRTTPNFWPNVPNGMENSPLLVLNHNRSLAIYTHRVCTHTLAKAGPESSVPSAAAVLHANDGPSGTATILNVTLYYQLISR
jgi:hypothetical protein